VVTDEGLKMSDELSGWLLTEDEEMDRLRNDEAFMGVEATVKRFLRSLKVGMALFPEMICSREWEFPGIAKKFPGNSRESKIHYKG